MDYADFKLAIEYYSGLEKDALHIHAALLLYLLAAIAFRKSGRDWLPWLFVLTIELLNESADLYRENISLIENGLGDPVNWGESFKDIWNTMLWPSALFLISQYRSLFRNRPKA